MTRNRPICTCTSLDGPLCPACREYADPGAQAALEQARSELAHYDKQQDLLLRQMKRYGASQPYLANNAYRNFQRLALQAHRAMKRIRKHTGKPDEPRAMHL